MSRRKHPMDITPWAPLATRRTFLRTSLAGAAAMALPSWLLGCSGPPGPAIVSPAEAVPVEVAESHYFAARFGITDEVIRKVFDEALTNGGDWADLFFQHRLTTSVSLEDNIVNKAHSGVDLGVGIRVVVGDQTGFAFTEELTLESMRMAARTAAGIAHGAKKTSPAALQMLPLEVYYDTEYDWQNVGIEQIATLVRGVNEAARAADPTVTRATVSFGSEQSHILVVDSDGRIAADNQPMTRLYLFLTMEENGENQTNYYSLAAREGVDYYNEERLTRLVDQAVARTKILFKATKPPAGEMPVVLAAGSSGILLHEAIGHGMEADFNRKGTSIFSDRVGTNVASEHITIRDSGLTPGLRGALNVDDEGMTTEATTLVEKGVLKGYLHDRISARHYGVEPTGSGRRQSFRHPPLPRMRTTYMENGPHERDEIIGSVKKGIYAVSFTNGVVEIGAGDYTFYVKNGYLIEDGKLTQPIKDVNIIGNGPESLSRITMVGNDSLMDEGGWTCGKGGQSVPVSLGLPTVLVSGISVGGSAS